METIIDSTCKDIFILKVGTEVRLALDKPMDLVSGKRLHGVWKASDIRWTQDYYKIYGIVFSSGNPPQYVVKDDKGNVKTNVIYTRQQLQI